MLDYGVLSDLPTT